MERWPLSVCGDGERLETESIINIFVGSTFRPTIYPGRADMPKKEPFTEAERKARREERSNIKFLERVSKAGSLTKTMSPNGGNNGSYFSFPDGKIAQNHIVWRVINDGRLRATGDGLFGDSQTYVVA